MSTSSSLPPSLLCVAEIYIIHHIYFVDGIFSSLKLYLWNINLNVIGICENIQNKEYQWIRSSRIVRKKQCISDASPLLGAAICDLPPEMHPESIVALRWKWKVNENALRTRFIPMDANSIKTIKFEFRLNFWDYFLIGQWLPHARSPSLGE